jgi:hypothetical protein
MNCKQFKSLLQEIGMKGLREMVPGQMHKHFETCAECKELVENAQYRELFDTLPVAKPSEGFAEKALHHAWMTKEGRGASPIATTHWLVASAATVALAIGVAFTVADRVDTRATDIASNRVEVTPYSIQQVDLLMVSEQALSEAWITLQMDEGVSLAGYPDLSTVRWSTSIAQGNNQLTLPVQLQGNRSGSIVVEVEFDGARKQMPFTVEAAAQRQQASILPVSLII